MIKEGAAKSVMTEEELKLIEQAKRQRERIKRQNTNAKANWDIISVRLPKGVKNKIIESGKTVNGLVNELISKYLDEHL